MDKQRSQLRQRPRLVVGTPGRINDHLERGTLKLLDTGLLVLDETDRMLDMGFSVQLDRIFKYMPKARQTLMFSATLPHNILKLSSAYLHNPERIAVGSVINPVENIRQEVVRVSQENKYEELIRQLNERQGSILVFVKTKYGTEKLAKRLRRENFDTDFIHGDLRQSRRDRVMRGFRDKKFRILFATDVAARGLDIPHIEHVINHDLPQVAEDYIHRIGRTARAGAQGSSLCLITPQDEDNWYAIECLMDPTRKKPKKAVRGRKRPNSKFQHKAGSKNKNKSRSRSKARTNDSSKGGQIAHYRKKGPAKEGKRHFYGKKKRKAA